MNNKTEINNSILAGNNNKISNVNIGSNKNDSSQQSPKNNPWKSGSFYRGRNLNSVPKQLSLYYG